MNTLVQVWNRFWFAPTATSTVAVLRIAYGILIVGWTLSLAPDLFAFFAVRGIVPEQLGNTLSWYDPLWIFQSDVTIVIMFSLLLLAAIALTLGWHARVASGIVFLGICAFQSRNPLIFNAGDGLVRLLAFYMMLAPSGVALSLDRLRKTRDRFWEFPLRAPWAIRLIQIQLSVIYLSTVWAKLRGVTWNDGTAIHYALRIGDLRRFPVPSFIVDSPIVVNLLTWGTLGVELALGILVWNRTLRPWVLWIGVVMHLLIDYSILVGFFSFVILVAYIAFVPPETMSKVILAVRDRYAKPGQTDRYTVDQVGDADDLTVRHAVNRRSTGVPIRQFKVPAAASRLWGRVGGTSNAHGPRRRA
ncbi:MAG: HTTM domain-containing protein [Pseudonocardiaceae bacterium]